MTYQESAALIDAVWTHDDDVTQEALTIQAQWELDAEIPQLIQTEAAQNATATCEGDIRKFHDIYYSSLIELSEEA